LAGFSEAPAVNLRRLFDPDSIAVIGASATEGKLGYEVTRTVSGFDGPVVPVNPNAHGEVFGRSFVPAIGDVEEDVDLIAVEAGGSSLEVDEERGVAPNSASLSTGTEGVLHGARTKLLQSEEGQIMESHSVSSGLDYAGVGPELSHLVDEGRVSAANVDDDAALEAFHRLSQAEGIIPALESAHALAFLEETDRDLGEFVVVNVSGRGDKDLEAAIEETARRDVPNAPEMEVFE
jgi:tryptophan synthase beta subunit